MLGLAQARNKPAHKHMRNDVPSTSPIGSSAAAIIIFIFSPPFVFILLTHAAKNPINYCQRSPMMIK